MMNRLFRRDSEPVRKMVEEAEEKENLEAVTPSKTKSIMKTSQSDKKRKRKQAEKRRVSFSAELEQVKYYETELAKPPTKKRRISGAGSGNALIPLPDNKPAVVTNPQITDDTPWVEMPVSNNARKAGTTVGTTTVTVNGNRRASVSTVSTILPKTGAKTGVNPKRRSLSTTTAKAKEAKPAPKPAEVVQEEEEEQMVEENKENEEPNIQPQSEPETVQEMDQEDLIVSYSFDKLIEEDEADDAVEAESITERMPAVEPATPLSFGDLIEEDEAETAEQSEEPVQEAPAEELNMTVEHVEESEAPRIIMPTNNTSLSFAGLIEEDDDLPEGDGTFAVTPVKAAPQRQELVAHQTDFDFHTVDDEIQRICSDDPLNLLPKSPKPRVSDAHINRRHSVAMEMTQTFGQIHAFIRKGDAPEPLTPSQLSPSKSALKTFVKSSSRRDSVAMDLTANLSKIISAKEDDLAKYRRQSVGMDLTTNFGQILSINNQLLNSDKDTRNRRLSIPSLTDYMAANVTPMKSNSVAAEDSPLSPTVNLSQMSYDAPTPTLKARRQSLAMDMTQTFGGILSARTEQQEEAVNTSQTAPTPNSRTRRVSVGMDMTQTFGGILSTRLPSQSNTPADKAEMRTRRMSVGMDMTQTFGGILSVNNAANEVEESMEMESENFDDNRTRRMSVGMDMTQPIGGIIGVRHMHSDEDRTRRLSVAMDLTQPVGAILSANMPHPGDSVASDENQTMNLTQALSGVEGMTLDKLTSVAHLEWPKMTPQPTNTRRRSSITSRPPSAPRALALAPRVNTARDANLTMTDAIANCTAQLSELEPWLSANSPAILGQLMSTRENESSAAKAQLKELQLRANLEAKKEWYGWAISVLESTDKEFYSLLQTDERLLDDEKALLETALTELRHDRRELPMNRLEARLLQRDRQTTTGPVNVESQRKAVEKQELYTLLTRVSEWKLRTYTPEQVQLEFNDKYEVTLDVTAQPDSVAVTRCSLSVHSAVPAKDKQLTERLLQEAKLESSFEQVRSYPELIDQLSELAVYCGRMSDLLREIKCLELNFNTEHVSTLGRGLSFAVEFSSLKSLNKFRVVFELSAHYPHAPIQASFENLWGPVSEKQIRSVLDNEQSQGRYQRLLTRICNKLALLCESFKQ